jgi:hypothetical protein
MLVSVQLIAVQWGEPGSSPLLLRQHCKKTLRIPAECITPGLFLKVTSVPYCIVG